MNLSQPVSYTHLDVYKRQIQYRLNSGRANYIAKGGKLGRKTGSTKTDDKKKEDYKEVIALLRKGYSIRNIAIDNWTKLGVINARKIGSRVYYTDSDINNALKKSFKE